MSPMKKPSSVEGLRRAAQPAPAPPPGEFADVDDDQWRERQRREPTTIQPAPAKPARITLNLSPDLAADFRQWMLAEAAIVGNPQLPARQQDVLRIMIRATIYGTSVHDLLREEFS